MTELVASVRLKADGSGLVGQANAAATAVKGIGTAAAGATGDARALAGATAGVEAGTRGLAAGAAAADRAVDQLGAAAREMASEQRQVAGAVADSVRQVDRYGRQAREAANDNARFANGTRNLWQQFGDLGLSIQGGISPARAFGQQAGQIGYALSEMGGRAGKVGAFLTGPWGIAMTIGAAVAAPFIERMFEGGKAADEQHDRLEKAATAADAYGSAQTLLGKLVDLSTGKIKTQNVALQQQIRLLAQANILDAEKRQKSAAQAARDFVSPTFGERAFAGFAAIGSTTAGAGNSEAAARAEKELAGRLAPVRSVVEGYVRLTQIPGASQGALDKGLAATIRGLDALGRSGKLAGRDLIDAKQAVLDLATAVNDQRANRAVVDVLDGGAVPDALKPFDRPKKGAKPRSTAALGEFGRDAGDRIAALTERFDQTPEALRRANAEIRQLDDLIEDLGRRRPPGFQQLIADAEAAKVTIRRGLIDGIAEAFDKPRDLADQAAEAFSQLDAVAADLEARRPPGFAGLVADVDRARAAVQDGLNRPFDEFVEAQEQAFQIGKLVAQGRLAEADALRTIVQLEKVRGPLTDAQKATILASNQALAAQERQIERLHRRQQAYLNALGDVQAIVRQTIYDGPGGLKELPGRLADAFKRFTAERLTESLFGNVFEDLRDQVTGTSVVEDASERMAAAVDTVSDTTARTTTALDDLTRAAGDAARGMASDSFGETRDAAGGIASDLLGRGATVDLDTPGGGQIGAALEDIVVVGRRLTGAKVDPFAGAFGQIATVLGKKIGIDDAKAARIGESIGGFASKGLRGAVEGQAASSVAGMLGLRTSTTGASIGGAIGSALPIPGGAIIGGLAGSLIGGLFKKTSYGTSAITSNGQDAVGTGSGSATRKAAAGLAGAVQDGIASIAEQLGGTLGNYNVSIGTYKDKFRVSTTGYTGRLGNQGSKTGALGIVDFGKDGEAEAVAFAILDAVKDGAVLGLSRAVQDALQSSTDPQKGLAEALKVQKLEELLGGALGQLGNVFRQFDAEAAERVRLAKRYGLDLLQVEKVNAEARADLINATLKARVQPLQDLLTSLTKGDLFEGDASERRQALLDEAARARADVDANKDGAAERLAAILGQLVSTSREAFGTAGPEYTSDRELARLDAERVIRAEEERVRAAAGGQEATTKAVEAGNALAGEANDLAADGNRILEQISRNIAAMVGPSLRVAPDLSLVAY